MPLFITLIIAKAIQKISRLLGRGGGSALPGLVAEKLDPLILFRLVRSLPKGTIVITGTNGKTTTTKMLVAILSQNGTRVITNRSGSNLTRGIISSLIEAANWRGKLPYDIGLFEVDEASMVAVGRLMKPNRIVVLNLFRDQLDRYGELDQTAKLIGKGIEQTRAEVFLNADDPLVASLGKYSHSESRVRYFGVKQALSTRLEHDLAADSDHCPICGLALKYSQNWFGHIGQYRCAEGHFDRPQPDYELTEIDSGLSGEVFEVKLPSGRARFSIELPGLYNAYNALAAIAVASSLGIAGGLIAGPLHRLGAAFGRVEKIELRGRSVYFLLIKNPTGFNQVIQTFFWSKTARQKINILMAINDNFADGRDVSWLWDVGVEELLNQEAEIICSGLRANDMAVRLKYAEIRAEVEPDLARALVRLVEATPEGEAAYVLPTYTAMFELRRLIEKEAGLEGFWK